VTVADDMGHRVVISQIGPDPLATFEQFAALAPMPRPDPTTLGPREVLVTIRSAHVGWVDLIMAAGQYQHVPKPPYTPGLEYSGTVAWAGPEVTDLEPGDRVLVDGFSVGPRSSGAYQQYGGFASYGVAPREAIHRIPGDLSFDQACNLLGNYETAYHCLIARGRLAAGETVLVHGASGSTGLAAVHVAKLVGATVIATGRTGYKLEAVHRQGADHVIETSTISALRDQVKQLTGGRGVDVVYDGVGSDLTRESLRCLRFGGRYLIVGWAATPGTATPLATNIIMMKGIDVLGCPTVISTVNDPTLRPPRLGQILAWAASGQLKPYVSHVFALGDFKDALRAKWNGEVIGGCVVRP
jgi:NADPH:quinone reductase